jgi:anthranilate synthase component 1
MRETHNRRSFEFRFICFSGGIELITPDREKYKSLSGEYNLIPVCCEISSDFDTPISIYKKIRPDGPAYLLESVEGGENIARFSFIGCDPFATFVSRGEDSLFTCGGELKTITGPPLECLKQVLGGFKVYAKPGLPRFYGGAVGYIAYDTVRFMERINIQPAATPALPDCSFVFAGTVLIYDHVRHMLTIVINSLPGSDPDRAYDEAGTRIQKVIKAINSNMPDEEIMKSSYEGQGTVAANMTAEEFMAKVVRAKEYIKAGDILQVVLSQRLKIPFRGDPFNIYRRLRTLNPSPYLYYLDLGEVRVAGSSPEMLVRVEGDRIETCPIAGTRPRGQDQAGDEAYAAELLQDVKERAEHVMLVDLGRNDLGKVSETGSVRLNRFMEVEKFSHVMHIVSNVSGRLADGKNCFDAIKACFPAGTVSGAPKVRAMEIIKELEPDGRGIYAGAIGYFSYNGNLDTAIAIRTIVFHEGSAYVQAGAGIVADSVPEKEYEEIMNKARVLINTLKEVG